MTSTNYLRETIDLVKQIETRFLELAKRLYAIRDKDLWKEDYDTFQEFLDTAKVSAGHASILMSIHKHYVVEGNIPPQRLAGVGYSNLYEAIPLIERKGVEETVETARLLTRSEIKAEVRDEIHPNCPHSDTVIICANCHKRV